MISLTLLTILTLLLIILLRFIFKTTVNYENEYNIMFSSLGAFGIIVFLFLIIIVISHDITKANELKAKIQIMEPVEINLAVLSRTKEEYKIITKLIKEAFDKYQIQATTIDFKGMTMFASPLAANSLNGVGDIERGSGEKLKNLEELINKQWELANKLIQLEKESYKPEFYELNQSLHILKNNVFSGLFVRNFMAKEIDIVYNKTYYAKGVNLDSN